MISASPGGVAAAGSGLIGVTRLIETGAEIGVMPFVVIGPATGVETDTMTVPVNVPFGSPDGSAKATRSTPSGGSKPLFGSTRMSHGLLSSVAVKEKL